MTLIVPKSRKASLPEWVERAAMPVPNFTPDANSTDPDIVLKSNLVRLGRCETPDEQKKLVFELLGPDYLKDIEALGPRVLVATHVWPQIRKIRNAKGEVISEFELPPMSLNRNRYEGKTGLVIAMGEKAFKYEGQYEWGDGRKPQIGDWIWYRASDAEERGFCGVYCRMIFDQMVEGIARDPTKIW